MTCMIDGSHMRATDLDYLIIRLAMNEAGMTLDGQGWEVYARAVADYPENVSDLTTQEVEDLRWLSERAIDHLNHRAKLGGVWYVEESCLWRDDESDDSDSA